MTVLQSSVIHRVSVVNVSSGLQVPVTPRHIGGKEAEVRRQGGKEARRQGGKEARRQGGKEARR